MRRRDLIALISSAAAVWPCAMQGQSSRAVRLVGVLMGFGESDRASQTLIAEFRATLSKLGWQEGNNLRLEVRWGDGDVERIGALAKELVDLHPDVILAQTTPVAVSLAKATQTIPIVFVTVSDPISSGLASSLTRPGGNTTGFTFVESEMGGKWVEFLKEIAPNTVRTTLLFNPTTAPPLKFYLPSFKRLEHH